MSMIDDEISCLNCGTRFHREDPDCWRCGHVNRREIDSVSSVSSVRTPATEAGLRLDIGDNDNNFTRNCTFAGHRPLTTDNSSAAPLRIGPGGDYSRDITPIGRTPIDWLFWLSLGAVILISFIGGCALADFLFSAFPVK